MSEADQQQEQPAERAPRWQPIGPIDRRVLGVLVEKAKTVPSGYPMTLNAICTGANQKNNRDPVMQLGPADVEPALERLRQVGAVGMIEGQGRVEKYRHYIYEWMGVDKVEAAVVAELLLRGAQTEGELRGRASRMEPIADLSALRPVLESLKAKGLVIPLTPPGRGHVVSHALYLPQELEKIKSRYAGQTDYGPLSQPATDAPPAAHVAEASAAAPGRAAAAAPAETELIDGLRRDIDELRAMLRQLQSDMHDLAEQQGRLDDDVRRLKDALGG